MRWNREEYINLLTYGKVERNMFVELFGPLIGLDEEWRKQGATEDEINLSAFDFDSVPNVWTGANTGILRPFEQKVLEDTPNYTISIDKYGRKVKLPKGYATIALPLEYPVKCMDDWLKIKHLFTYDHSRINFDWLETVKKRQNDGELVCASMEGGFDLPRELMGDEYACICYYEDPELMQDILDTLTDTTFKVLDKVSDVVTIDNLFVHEDLAGKSGPLVGPNQINEFIKPYYRKIWDMLSAKGAKIFSQDSDGNMNPVIDSFIECGVNVFYPLEPAAGMDIVELRKKYGNKIAFKGGIDKHALRGTKEDIRKELEYKLQPLMQTGGCVFGLDHRIPNGVSIENYRYYVDLARELLNIPRREKKTPHVRMAF